MPLKFIKSKSDVKSFAISVMNVGALDKTMSIKNWHGPLIPNFLLRIVSPYLDLNFLA